MDDPSEALPTTARTLNRSFTLKRMSNCEGRTCPGSLRSGLRWIRTRNPQAAMHRTYPTPPRPTYIDILPIHKFINLLIIFGDSVCTHNTHAPQVSTRVSNTIFTVLC